MSKSTRAGCASHVLIPVEENTALRDRKGWPCFKVHHGNMLSILYADHTVIVFISCVSPLEIFIRTYLCICLVGTTQEVSPRSHFTSFVAPCGTAHKTTGWFFYYGNKSNVCSSFGFIVKSNNFLHPSCTYIVKKYCCQCPHPACKR